MIKAYFIPLVGSSICIITITFNYFLATTLHDQKKWPFGSYISNCARHYPQFLFYRVGNLVSTSLLIIAWILRYFWFVKKDAKLNIFALLLSGIGILSFWFSFISTATIDTGDMNKPYHQTTSRNFFILSVIAQTYDMILCLYLWIHRVEQNGYKILIKFQLCLNFILIEVYTAWGQVELGSGKSILIEYVGAYNILLYYFLTSLDYNKQFISIHNK